MDEEVIVSFTESQEIKKPATGLNIIGFFQHAFGIGESARCSARAAAAAGIPVALNAARIGTDNAPEETEWDAQLTTENPHPFNLFHLDPPQMRLVREHHGVRFCEGRYNIGYWAWELPEFPDAWLRNFEFVDEVWTPSGFARDAIAAKSPVPVLVMPHAIDFAAPPPPSRGRFGLPEGEFLFLVLFDLNSSLARKNPQAALAAFREAFPNPSAPIRLVIKVQNAERHPREFAELAASVREMRNVTLLSGTFSRDEIHALHARCDCFVSLHRAEGFGLALAEAMHLGKPVIATNWSGNLEFMDAANSCLVDFELVELRENHGPYLRGQRWAEPDVSHAAHWMRRIATEPQLRAEIGAAASETVRRQLAPARIGNLYAQRLESLSHWL